MLTASASVFLRIVSSSLSSPLTHFHPILILPIADRPSGLHCNCTVTQIPLDTPSLSREFPQTKPLPPWIRPVRKKTPSAPRSSGSHESPSQDNNSSSEPSFSPGDMFVDLSVLPPDKLVSSNGLVNTLNAVGAVPTSPRQYSIGVSGHTAPFMDTSSSGVDPLNIKPDPSMALTPAEIMALFNDGGMDMASLFPSDFMADDMGAGGSTLYSQSQSSAFGKSRGAGGSNGDLSGLVSSP